MRPKRNPSPPQDGPDLGANAAARSAHNKASPPPEAQAKLPSPEPPSVPEPSVPNIIAPDVHPDLVIRSVHRAPITSPYDLDTEALRLIDSEVDQSWDTTWGRYLTHDQLKAICAGIRAGQSVRNACIAAGIRPGQIEHWLSSWNTGKIGPRSAQFPFLSFVMGQTAKAIASLELECINAIRSGYLGYEAVHFERTGERIRYTGDWRAAVFVLQVRFPETWSKIDPETAARIRAGAVDSEEDRRAVLEQVTEEITTVSRRLTRQTV